ncbi:MAG: polyphosphate kinase 2 family protein [Bacteroidales bacterium]|nr:polyphosphate kinase 2 family protein [Bacteroidales bacterium]MDZ4204150.1 polyphosphate kinase 2 family protein [Bacteroidales bacterium]
MKNLLHDRKIWAKPGKKHHVSDFDTEYTADFIKKNDALDKLDKNLEEMIQMQDKLYADSRYSLLLVFQAMDAAGKDGTIKHVMSGVNPQGTQVFSFKTPTATELDHDYLWRIYKRLPERGNIGIFNRSHYEEVLVVKVHPEFLLRQQLPDAKNLNSINDNFWMQRYHQINNFEKHLSENGTVILKFFLNVSKEEQKKRFLKRIDDPARNWKFSANDVKERSFWNAYMQAYSEMLTHTSTDYAPWFVIPADNKWFMRYAVSNIIINRLKELNLEYPTLPPAEMAGLEQARQMLMEEK